MSEEKLYQHFHPDEHRFIDHCLDWLDQVEQSYSVIVSHFLNPRELEILQILVNKRDVQLFSSQDLVQTEQAKVIIAPRFYLLDEKDFDLVLLEINYASKFVELSHSQVLGAFLGETGIKRQELGDIIVTDGKVQVFVSQHLVEIFKTIKKIGHTAVKIKEIPITAVETATDKAVSEIVSVDSLRVDKVIAIAFKISRNAAVNVLESNKVKINYLESDKKDFAIGLGNLISVRGFGRIKILQILGQTKKGKQRIEIEIIKNRKK